jgi:hypothetical protein
VLTLDHAATRVARVGEVLRDEWLFAWVPTRARSQVTAALYTTQSTYLPGGPRFDAGLFDWERRVLATPPFPSHGRVLLGGAGGGRELVGLSALKYRVVAFEPSSTLAAGAKQLAAGIDGTEVYQASYADLIRAIRCGEGPLAKALLNEHFDAIVLGWGSFSHLTDPDERVALLHAVRDLAPDAPVMLSWLPPPTMPGVDATKVQQVLRRLFAVLGASGTISPGDGFISGAGFYTGMVASQVKALADDAGYCMVLDERWPYPHALLEPKRAKHGSPPLET